MSDSYLTLGEAASTLGVHTATVRRWADAGKLPFHRTPGGHRRFLQRDIHALVDGIPQPDRNAESIGERIRESTLVVARHELSRADAPSWVTVMDEKDREEKKLLGRRLMGLLMQYLSSDDEHRQAVLDEASVVGRIYAVSIRQSGVSLPEATRALMFFRDQILESAVLLPDSALERPEANRRTYRRITEFLNCIQLAIVDQFDDS